MDLLNKSMHIVKVFVTYCSFALHELCTNLYASNDLCYCIQENIRYYHSDRQKPKPERYLLL